MAIKPTGTLAQLLGMLWPLQPLSKSHKPAINTQIPKGKIGCASGFAQTG